MYRKTYLEIDCNKLENNIKSIIKEYKGYKYYFGVVKNNAYNHGIDTVKYMINAGINYLCVSSLEEALNIRKINKRINILILEPINILYVNVATKNNITITIDDYEYFNQLLKNKIKCKFHLKVDSGMNRFGLKDKDSITNIFNNSNDDMYLEGIYTHLTTGNKNSNEYNNSINKFKELTSDIDLNKIDIIHLDRSLTLEQHDKIEFANGVRLGIIMYGYNRQSSTVNFKRKVINMIKGIESENYVAKLNLEPIVKFYSEVIEIKNIKKGEEVGYGGMHIASEDERIAIIPFGFADFLYNKLDYVSINNKKYKIIVINMDVTIIKIDNDVRLNDVVEIFGDNISVRRKALSVNQNIYKLIASVSNRVPRVLVYNGEIEEIKY